MLTIKVKLILAVTLIFTLFLGLSLVSASDINIDDTVSLKDNNIKTSSSSIAIDDVEDNMNDDNGLATDSNPTVASTNAGDGEIVKDSSNSKSITELNKTINSGNSSILLDDDYTYNQDTDSRFINLGGIRISSDLTIDGQGHTIDLGGKIRFLNVTGSVTLKNINIINGYAYSGGAIYIEGKGCIINSTFTSNKAHTRYGGAIYNEGNCSIINSTFTYNYASSSGGAIANLRHCSVINSTFSYNNAGYGGAIYHRGNCSVINSTFSYNNATYCGGAINIDQDNTMASVINSTFSNNNANYGGAIYYYSGILNVTISKFTDNFGNIVYYKTKGNIYVDSTTRSLSDPDLICNKIDKIILLNNYTYESDASIFINVSGVDKTSGLVYGAVYAVIDQKIYSGYVMNGTGSIALSGLSAGMYNFEIIYNGTDSDTWGKFRKTGFRITVYKSEEVDMNVSASNITYGEEGLVNITFNQTVQGLAYITYDNKIYSVNISGDSGIITVPGLMPGDYNFDVYFNSSNYKASMKTVSFTVFKNDPVIDVTVANITYGEDAVIFVNFAEEINGTVYLIYNNVNYTGNITNGQGNITIKGLNANDYNLNVIYDGTIIYNATSAPAVFTVFKTNSTISVTADDVEYGNVVLVNVTTDCEDGDIFLVINNQTYTGYIRNGIGIINVIGLEPGYYSTNVTYNGSVNYNPCVAPVNFTVLKQNATVTTKVDIVDGDVLITVFTNGDDSVAYVTIDNVTYSTNIVNLTGVINITGLDPGYYEVNLTYNGSIHYNPSVVLVNFTVNNKTNSTINVNVEDVVYPSNVILNITTDCDDGLVFVEVNGQTYTGNIRGGEGVIIIPGLDPGFYELNVTYNGSSKYYPCVVPVNFTVEKINTTLIISKVEVSEDNVLITVSTPGPDSIAYIVINGQTYTGNIVNNVGVINITGLEPGYYEANVTYNGTKYYNPCDAPVNFTFGKNESSITVTADDVVYPGDIILNVTTDCDDGLIFVEVNGQTYTGYILSGNGSIIIPGLEPGFYELNVTYNGSDRYNPCVAPVNFTVLKQNATVTTKVDIVDGDVLITVFTDGDDSVAYVTIGNVTYSTNIVNLTGVINITGLKPGNYSLNLTYNGTKYYNPCDVPVNFTINKIPTSISASDATYVLNYANVYKVTFNPKLAGFNITFTLNGKIVGSAITDASGVARINLTAAQLKAAGAGKRNMLVSFAGDDTYLASNVTKTITINKEATKFINVKSVKKSYKSTAKSMQLTATLKNSKNKVIKRQWVYFKINNKKIYKVKTNSKGVAKLTLNSAKIKACKLNKKGNYRFTVTYKTTATYKQTSKKGILKVLK